MADVSPAVFKTVCGALLRRPGWVRFPSIPANFKGVTTQAAWESTEAVTDFLTPCKRGLARSVNAFRFTAEVWLAWSILA